MTRRELIRLTAIAAASFGTPAIQKRQYEFSGNHLTVKSTDPNEHWKVVWEHY